MNRVAFLTTMTAILTVLSMSGCDSDEIYRIKTGYYVVRSMSYTDVPGLDQQEIEALEAITLNIDREQRSAEFTLADSTRIAVTWTVLPKSEWLSEKNCGSDGSGIGSTTDWMEVAVIDQAPLVLESMVFENPALKATCPTAAVVRLTEADHEVIAFDCSGSGKCISFQLDN